MIERSQHLRFARESREPIHIGGERLRQDLDRHVAVELRVVRAIDLTHAARAKRRTDFIGAEAST